MLAVQPQVRAAVCRLRRTGRRPWRPLRRPLLRSTLVHVVAALLRDGAILRRIRRGQFHFRTPPPDHVALAGSFGKART